MFIAKIFKPFFDIILPQYCLGCRARKTLLCENCLIKITPARYQENDNIFSAFDYRDPVIRSVLWEIKYKNKRELAKTVGNALYNNLIEDISEIKSFSPGKPIIIIPIPLFKKRLRERGYNQALLIARGMVENSPTGLFEINENFVRRIKETPPQAKISNRQKRLKNVRDAFVCESPLRNGVCSVSGRTVIVLDDVTTTGGTLMEVMKLVKKAGAKKVLGFAVAH